MRIYEVIDLCRRQPEVVGADSNTEFRILNEILFSQFNAEYGHFSWDEYGEIKIGDWLMKRLLEKPVTPSPFWASQFSPDSVFIDTIGRRSLACSIPENADTEVLTCLKRLCWFATTNQARHTKDSLRDIYTEEQLAELKAGNIQKVREIAVGLESREDPIFVWCENK